MSSIESYKTQVKSVEKILSHWPRGSMLTQFSYVENNHNTIFTSTMKLPSLIFTSRVDLPGMGLGHSVNTPSTQCKYWEDNCLSLLAMKTTGFSPLCCLFLSTGAMKARVGTRQGKWHLPGCHSHIYNDVTNNQGRWQDRKKGKKRAKMAIYCV